MNNWADFVVGQFIGGQALYLGIALSLVGCVLKLLVGRAAIQAIARVSILAGGVVVVLSAAPFPFWVYGLFFGLLGLAAFLPANVQWRERKVAFVPVVLLIALSLSMVGAEVRSSRRPTIRLTAGDTLVVLGDSLSMGADRPGKNWPDLLGELANLKVRNLSYGGATVGSALDEVRRIHPDDTLVIIELGGNDLLGGTSIAKFRQDLEKMLTSVGGAGRRVVMIELPLPPFCNRFGMVQRELARSHGVTLIPKRYLAKVLSTPGATVDGLHLSNAGHAQLARAMSEMFTPAQANKSVSEGQ